MSSKSDETTPSRHARQQNGTDGALYAQRTREILALYLIVHVPVECCESLFAFSLLVGHEVISFGMWNMLFASCHDTGQR